MPQGGRDARGRLPASARGREACVRRAANVTMSDSERLATMTMTAMAMDAMTMMTTGRQSGAVPHAAGTRGMGGQLVGVAMGARGQAVGNPTPCGGESTNAIDSCVRRPIGT